MSERGGAVASYGLPSPQAAHGVRRAIGGAAALAKATVLAHATDSSADGLAPPTCATVGPRSARALRTGDPSDGEAGS